MKPTEIENSWQTYALFIVGVAISLSLIASSLFAYITMQNSIRPMLQGQGSLFFKRLLETRAIFKYKTSEALENFITDYRDEGLLYVGLFDIQSFEAGSTPYEIDHTKIPHGLNVYEYEDRIRFCIRAPRRHPSNFSVPQHIRPWRLIVIDFRSKLAESLRWRSKRVLISGLIGSLTVFFGTLALLRLLQQRVQFLQSLAQREQLAALGQMSATLAHEIRNPLASAKGHSQLLVESLDPESRAGLKSKRVLQELQRLELLANDLLDFVKSGNVQKDNCSPQELINEAIHSVGLQPEQIVLDTSNCPPQFALDARKFGRVLANLLSNAQQANSEGGKVHIHAGETDKQLTISIRDEGPGLPIGVNIFTPFVTTRVRGHGLGLSVAKQITEAHGGTIEAQSTENGAEFLLTIPS